MANKKKGLYAYARFSSLILQMAAVVLIGAWAGKKLDAHFHTSYITMILVLISMVSALIYFFWTITRR